MPFSKMKTIAELSFAKILFTNYFTHLDKVTRENDFCKTVKKNVSNVQDKLCYM